MNASPEREMAPGIAVDDIPAVSEDPTWYEVSKGDALEFARMALEGEGVGV